MEHTLGKAVEALSAARAKTSVIHGNDVQCVAVGPEGACPRQTDCPTVVLLLWLLVLKAAGAVRQGPGMPAHSGHDSKAQAVS